MGRAREAERGRKRKKDREIEIERERERERERDHTAAVRDLRNQSNLNCGVPRISVLMSS